MIIPEEIKLIEIPIFAKLVKEPEYKVENETHIYKFTYEIVGYDHIFFINIRMKSEIKQEDFVHFSSAVNLKISTLLKRGIEDITYE